MKPLLVSLLAAAVVGTSPPARVERTFSDHRAMIRGVAFSPDSRILATASADGNVKLRRVSDGRLLRTLVHPVGITSVAFSDDGRTLVCGSYDHTVRVWSSPGSSDVRLARTLRGHEGTVWSVAVSPDGELVASSGEDRTVRIWNAGSGALLRTLRGHTLNVWSVAFSPDGRSIVSGSFDHTVKVWRTDTGALVRTLAGHTQAVVAVSVSGDGRWIASGGDDSKVRLWRLADGTLARTLDASNHVYALAFSPDSRRLATAGRERGALGTLWKQVAGTKRGDHGVTVRIWGIDDGSLRQALSAHADDVPAVAFSPDGSRLATGGEDRTVVLWRLTSEPVRLRVFS